MPHIHPVNPIHTWECACCTTPNRDIEIYGGRCTICDGIICTDCIRTYNRRYGYHSGKPGEIIIDALSPEYTAYLKTIKPHIIHWALIAICIKCVTRTETEYLYTYPYEQLGLLVNHVWYGTDTDRLYKDRLSGLKP